MGLTIPVLELFSNNTKPYGLTFEQWCMKWWSWLLKIPNHKNPANDATGENAYVNQVDTKVFFLCQSFEQQRISPSRRISIQRGKSLFFPLINWISVLPEDGKTDEDLMTKANAKMKSVKDLTVIVNGRQITEDFCKYRVQSRPFHVELPEENILRLLAGKKRVVSDGYWILTKPITDGFKLSTFGSCTSGLTKICVNYEITLH